MYACISMYLNPSIYLLSTDLCINEVIYVYVYIYIYIYIYIHLCIHQSIHPSDDPSICVYICLSTLCVPIGCVYVRTCVCILPITEEQLNKWNIQVSKQKNNNGRKKDKEKMINTVLEITLIMT